MDTLQQISDPIRIFLETFDQEYHASLGASTDTLLKSIQHIRASQGKRIRPIMVALIAQAVAGKTSSATLESALALELLHTASLIHDDVIDLAPTRRGQPTLHTIYNNHAAVLVGDFLVSSAFMRAAQTTSASVIATLGKVGKELSEGELLQIELSQHPTFLESDYLKVISRKTAALFEACALLGAVSVEASASVVEQCRQVGHLIGLAFQMKDDILDYLPSEKLGKPSGNDLREGKITLPLLYALNLPNDPEAQRLKEKISCAIAPEEIPMLIQFALDKGGIGYTENKIQELITKAVDILNSWQPSPEKTALIQLTQFLIQRDY